MKKPETDRELTDLIVNTLGNSEEHYIIGSWENFVKKRKQRRKLILWFSSTGFAASVLIGWLGFRFFVTGSASLNTDPILLQQITGNQETTIIKDTSRYNNLIRRDTFLLSENTKANHQIISVPGQNINAHGSKIKSYTDSLNSESKMETGVNKNYDSTTTTQLAERNTVNHLSDTVKSGLPSQYVINEADKYIAASQKTDSSGTNPHLSFAVAELSQENDISSNAITRKVRFGVSFSPGVSSTNTVSSFNYSGGITADMDLSPRFSLSTGLQVEHQNVINEATDSPSWLPAGQKRAVLVGIDLPINIIWRFIVKKSGCYYISSGLSSIAYLSEKYITTSYSQKIIEVVSEVGGEQTVDYKVENVENTEQKNEEPLNSFDFAGRVNIIFGFEQQLSSKIYIHLEPFVKIPISGLASHDLRFTTSGITCKISF